VEGTRLIDGKPLGNWLGTTEGTELGSSDGVPDATGLGAKEIVGPLLGATELVGCILTVGNELG
jgi:hypothetical protein